MASVGPDAEGMEVDQAAVGILAGLRGGGPWRVTARPDRGPRACCVGCKHRFHDGALRVSRAGVQAQRSVHAACLGEKFGKAADIHGLAELAGQARDDVQAFFECGDAGVSSAPAATAPWLRP